MCVTETETGRGACSVIYPVIKSLWQTDPSSWLTMLTVAEKKNFLTEWSHSRLSLMGKTGTQDEEAKHQSLSNQGIAIQ